MRGFLLAVTAIQLLVTCAQAACTSSSTSTTDLQNALEQGGEGYTLQLCAAETYNLDQTLNFTAANQEISTEGYPTDDSRALLVIDGSGVSTAVRATGIDLSGVKLRNVQINGNRNGADIYQGGGANIEFGGPNGDQLVEYVRSYDPRGWSCLHISEGPFECRNVTIQNNDIGPCGSEQFQEWADGISLSCQSSLVQNNVITDATDGGIVVFGAPFSTIRNNTIGVKTRTTLGGINLVDVLPWAPPGNYSHTVVSGNHINGGFATGTGNDSFGTNNASAMIKIGIAIGPEVWFNQRFGNNQSTGGVVSDNVLSGAFAFGIAIATARDFVVSNNSFAGNVSFIGDYGQNCTGAYLTPNPPTPLLSDNSSITNITFELPTSAAVDDGTSNVARTANISNFVNGTASGLTCFIHPDTSFVGWPYGDGGVNAESPTSSSDPNTADGGSGGTAQSSSAAPAPSSTESDSGNGAVGAPNLSGVASAAALIMSSLLGGLTLL